MENILHIDPEEVCKMVLAANSKITQVEYYPITAVAISFIFRIGGKRYGGTIVGGKSVAVERDNIDHFISIVKNY